VVAGVCKLFHGVNALEGPLRNGAAVEAGKDVQRRPLNTPLSLSHIDGIRFWILLRVVPLFFLAE